MNKLVASIVGLTLFAVFVIFSATYTVKYNEVAIKATFGNVSDSGIVRDPGLHFRLPIFIDRVTKLDTRLQLVESPLEEIVTADGIQIVARAFMLWKVDTESETGPRSFFDEYTTVANARSSLQGTFRAAFTGGVSGFRFDELVGESSRLVDAEEAIRTEMTTQVSGSGVEPISVGISQLMLPPRTITAVLDRMKAEREALRESENRAGAAVAAGLLATANSNADKITAFADQRAAEIRSAAEQQSARFLEQMREEEDLAIFLVWLEALERSLSEYTTIVFDAANAPFHLLQPGAADDVRSGSVPQPAGSGGGG